MLRLLARQSIPRQQPFASRSFHLSLSTRKDAGPETPIRALIIGSPGSGKGTLSKRLLLACSKLQYISAGDVLRHERQMGTELGKQADEVMRRGSLMPDGTMMNIVDSRVRSLGNDASWLLDGFPRTRGQAVMFDAALRQRRQHLDVVLHLDVPNDVVLSRILDRWIHEPSGRTYNMSFNPPKVPGVDDVTGERLSKRVDDDANTFKSRLLSYDADTQPMVDYFSSASGKSSQEPVYVKLSGTSSDAIWPIMLERVKELFGDAIRT